jgi:type VI secretion system protein ImpJ
MTRSVRDEITGADEKTVQLAKKNFRLLLEAESDRQALVTLPLARVRRDQAGQFVYDGEYVPPCLHIGASPALLRLLDRLLGILESKAESLSTERLDGGGRASLADMTEREIVSFWLSHAVHSAIPPIRHLSRTPAAHPEAVYGELARLAGALCTFALDADPRDLPAYDHDAPQSCLAALDGHIRQLINVLLPPEAARMALRPSEKYFYTAAVTDRRSLGSARWFLGIRSSAPRGVLVPLVPDKVKVCSARFVVELVKRAHPGLRLEHVAVPPPMLGPRLGTEYFSIERTGPCWDTIADTAEVGVYVPGAIPDPELELVVIPET